MKKSYLLCLFTCVFAYLNAQEKDSGMHFEHNSTWKKVLAKAKKENKYIFVDCFTTWCGPCKIMAYNVFPKPEVGDYYNTNFINLKLQMDKTSKDNEYIKSWYSLSDEFEDKYPISAYPTYLIFNKNGGLVYRFIGSMEADAFIIKGKEAVIFDTIIPENEYYSDLHKYKAGERSPAFLYQLTSRLVEGRNVENHTDVIKDYFSTQKDFYKKENLQILVSLTKQSSDTGFKILVANPQKADSILGLQKADNIVRWIIFNEEISPTLPKAGTGVNPDWTTIENKVYLKYPNMANKSTLFARWFYYGINRDWKNYTLAVHDYIKNTKYPSAEQLNQFAWQIFQASDDTSYLKNALNWSKQSFINQAKIEPGYIDTYANILYKLGEKNQALEWELKAQSIAVKNGADRSWGQDVIDKINKGKKTW